MPKQLDQEREAFAAWAESVREKYPNITVDGYNLARDAWLEINRRNREAAARASGFARQAAERTGEELIEEHTHAI
ncbi:hypothetical protein [Bordetella genomosp. 11]|uniref:Uncharacterized protein n=1 Tax=Bordetella genomosp. 11 TaxID=1416808 RepID=A0A261UDB6_9BORD|nr:hypothetical protein [Bordetella genomosp. 11]OZI59918.1 hypothetical protein CAL28_10540 [Bordetella genomosp. 11]